MSKPRTLNSVLRSSDRAASETMREALPQRVLLFDPRPASGRELQHWLRSAQYRVEAVDSYSDARKVLESDTLPDVVIVASDALRFDGVDPAERIAHRLRAQEIPLVLVLRTTDEAQARRALQRGIRFVLPEPHRQADLLALVERALLAPRDPHAVASAYDSLWSRFESTEDAPSAPPTASPAGDATSRALFDHSADGLFLLDLDGTILDVNARACARLGYGPDELIGRNISTIEERTTSAGGSAKDSLEPDRIAVTEAVHLTRDGTRIPVQVRTSILVMEGQPRVLSSATDIRERQALEARMRQYQKMEAISRLAGGIAHDFNNALTVMLTHAEFLLEDLPAGSPTRSDVEQIRAAAQRVGTWTQQLLALSQDPGQVSEVLDCNAVVREVGEVLRRVAGDEIKVDLTLGDEPMLVRAVQGRLTQILLNLAENAREAMPRGGTLRVRTKRVVVRAEEVGIGRSIAPGTYVALTVEDTGAGMDADTVAHAFEPFFTTKPLGSGMGLAVVFSTVTQLGGGVHVDSTPGRGTTITLYLPWSSSPRAAARPATPAPTTLTGSETILLVEDDEPIRLLAQRALTRLGYRVIPAADAMQALTLYNRLGGQIDLLITDVMMPHMTGGELVRRLEALGAAPKVLYITGYTEDVLIQDGIADVQTSLLRKPFTPEPLAQKVRQILDRGDGGAVTPSTGRLRLLLVDDDPTIRRALTRVLRAHDVVEAGTLDEARKLLGRDQAFDLLLCDVGLPDGSGLDLHRWLAERLPAMAAKVIFLTGGLQSPADHDYVRSSGRPTIDKPFDPAGLDQQLRAFAAAP